MKKVFALVLALALALTFAVSTFAAVGDDVKKAFDELVDTFGVDAVQTAVKEELDKLKDIDLLNTDAIPDGTAKNVADGIAGKLGADSDLADKFSGLMSNDFVSFLAGMYTGDEEVTTVVDVVDPPEPVVKTGDSTVIAIAAFATITVAAAAAFVCLKKKDD